MIRITEGQYAVLGLLRKGIRRSVIAQQLGRRREAVYITVNRMIAAGIIVQTDPGKYEFTGKPYTVRKSKSGAVTVPTVPKQPTPVHGNVTVNVPITPKQAAYIRQHVETKPRRQMAREMGVDKVTLNMMIMQLKLGRSG